MGTLIDFETGILEWFQPALHRHETSKTDGEILAAFATVEDDEGGFGATPTPEKVVTPTFHATGMADPARQVRKEQRSSGSG